MASRRYNWIYSHNLRPFMLGRDDKSYGTPERRVQFMDVIARREVVTDPALVKTAEDLRNLVLRDYSGELRLDLVPTFAGPREELEVGLMPVEIYRSSPVAAIGQELWNLGCRIHNGEELDLAKDLNTQTQWLLIGPFDNTDKRGFAEVYPPETASGPDGEYNGVIGNWTFALFQRVLGSASAFSRSMLIVVISSTMSSSVL